MLNLLFALLFAGCITTKKQIEHARGQIIGQCLEKIQAKLLENNCNNIEYYRGHDQFVFRCEKVDKMRKNMWDTWWFRLTSSIKEWPPEKLAIIEQHTICTDGLHRLEAYPPEKE